ncbi:hypothetical protein [Falsiphaeobacter marinintestinus]|uniref:hypothetical protein n=1 Tax=Falsiphaeobacter marinintestinus TaxID=1492905 RepID=UPI0011B84AC5|nr:hypothetical protein [Phaeobacter marinintestinus]
MFNPKRVSLILAAATLLPTAALADTNECPSMQGVLDVIQPQGTGETINQARLIDEVGNAATSTPATRGLGNDLRSSLPGNPETIIGDLMIAAYCEYLVTSQSDVELDTSLHNYQEVIFNDVLANPNGTVSDADSRPDGWLMSD